MTHQIDENDICRCGSGKKVKNCCISALSARSEVLDFGWHRLRQMESIITDKHLIPYIKRLPAEVMETALGEFFPADLIEIIDKRTLFDNFFIPWLQFNWIPRKDFGMKSFKSEMTIAQNYLNYEGDKLNSAERHFIEAMNKTHYSFYHVLEVSSEKSLIVKDILLGSTHTVKERQEIHQLKRADIVFSRILTLDNQSIFIGMSPLLVPIPCHTEIIDFRQLLIEKNNKALDATFLRDELDKVLIDYFFEIVTAIFKRPLPKLCNAEGDPLQFSKSYFKLTASPEATFHQLLPLTLTKDPENFLQTALFNESGALKKIEFHWLKKGHKNNKALKHTIMGSITIENNRLVLETNSENRTKQGKKLLNKHLGSSLIFQQTLIESLEQKIKSLAKEKNAKLPAPTIRIDELPKMGEQTNEMTRAYWQNWLNQPVAMLGNETPREAVKTTLGREKLEAVLFYYERRDLEKADRNLFQDNISYIRAELSLD